MDLDRKAHFFNQYPYNIAMGNSAATTTTATPKPAPYMSVYAVHCHLCGGVFVISNTCTSCAHVQCQKCL